MKSGICAWSVCGILVLAGCAPPSPPANQSQLDVRRLGAADFAVVRDAAAGGPTQLHYIVYRYDARLKTYVAERGGQLQGFLTHRDRDGYRLLPDGSYDDGQFNRIEFVPLQDQQQQPMLVSVSATPDGTSIFALEGRDHTPRLRLIVFFRDRGLLGVLGEREMLGELPCLDASARRGSVTDLLRCVGLAASEGAGGPSGGSSGLPGAGGLLSEPDCKENPLGPAVDSPNAEELKRRETALERLLEEAREARDRQTDADARAAYDAYIRALTLERNAIQAVQRELSELNELRSRVPPPTAREMRQAEFELRLQESILRGAHNLAKDRLRALQRYQSGGGSTPSPSLVDTGEPAPVADPRCKGRQVDSARGTLFTNRDFCGDDDPLTCLRRQADSLYGLTEGQCWTETGPDDRPTLVCNERTRQHPDNPLESGPPQPPDCDATDVDCFTDPVAPRYSNRSIATRYFDLTPMADVIAALCASGGCPDPVEHP
jgi:hypothetical protein